MEKSSDVLQKLGINVIHFALTAFYRSTMTPRLHNMLCEEK